jgi:hypothetical protein
VIVFLVFTVLSLSFHSCVFLRDTAAHVVIIRRGSRRSRHVRFTSNRFRTLARQRIDMECRNLRLHQSALAPENLTTLAHFSVSSAMSFPKSAAPARRFWESCAVGHRCLVAGAVQYVRGAVGKCPRSGASPTNPLVRHFTNVSTIFLFDPHFGGDGLVMVIRHRDPDKAWTIRHPSSWRPNWSRRQRLAVDGPTVRRCTAHGLESEWRER